MLLALLADVHADLPALRDALAQASRLGCKEFVCAGDLVGYGAHPDETVALLYGCGAVCVRGNHDRWATDPATRASLAARLSSESLEYLGALPQLWQTSFEGVRLAMCHASPTSDMEGIQPGKLTSAEVRALLAGVNADVLIAGHTHAAFQVLDAEGGLIVNPGSLMRTPVGAGPAAVRFDTRRRIFVDNATGPRGTFAVLELPAKKVTLHLASDGSELPLPTVRTGTVGEGR